MSNSNCEARVEIRLYDGCQTPNLLTGHRATVTKPTRYKTDSSEKLSLKLSFLDYESEIVGSMNTLNNWIHSKSHAQTDFNLTLTLLAAVNGNKINASILKYAKEI